MSVSKPTPTEDQTFTEFMQECIPMVLDEGTAEDQEQATAICYSIWREHKKETE